MQAETAYGDLPHQPMFATVLLQQPVLREFYQRVWPRVFAGATGGVADSRWDNRTSREGPPHKHSPQHRASLLLAVCVGALAIGVGVWLVWQH